MRNAIRACAALAGFLALTAGLDAAPPTLEQLFPAGGQRGTTVSVNITGKLDSKTKTWCSCDAAKLSLNTKSKKLQVAVPHGARPGLHWIRLFNDDGASQPKAFLIGTLPEVIEKEPNEKIEQSQPLKSSAVVNGTLSKSGDVDTFAITLKKGQTLIASMTANNTLGSPMDGILQVVSPRGFVLEQNDDDRGFDPQLAYTAKEDGTVHVRAFAFPAMPNSSVRLSGASNYLYRLTITTGPFVDHVIPLATTGEQSASVKFRGWNIPENLKPLQIVGNIENLRVVSHTAITETEPNAADEPQAVSLPISITGHIDAPRDVDVFRFQAKKGDSLRCRIEARSFGSPLDPVLRLLDAKGTVVATAETRSSKDIDEILSYRVPADGDYRLEVADLYRHGGWRYVYRLTMSAGAMLDSLNVAADRYTILPGRPLTIPVTIAGVGISPDDLKFEVRGLPPGIAVATSTGATTTKSKTRGKGRRGRGSRSGGQSVQLTLTAKAGTTFNGPIHIVAVKAGETQRGEIAAAGVAGTSERTESVWLTVSKSALKTGGKKPVKK